MSEGDVHTDRCNGGVVRVFLDDKCDSPHSLVAVQRESRAFWKACWLWEMVVSHRFQQQKLLGDEAGTSMLLIGPLVNLVSGF